MANWIKAIKADKFPHVAKAFLRIAEFRDAAKAEANGAAVWARWPANLPHGSANLQVDVAAVPGVPALTSSGRLA